jgi:threonine synthase
LQSCPHFNFKRDVLPEEFVGLLDRQKRVVDIERPDVGLVKDAIERMVDNAEGGKNEVVALGTTSV